MAPTSEALHRYAGRHPEARCSCGRRATYFHLDWSWQCSDCGGLPAGPPAPAPDPATAEYERLYGVILDLHGAAYRAQDAGDHAAYRRLLAQACSLAEHEYADLRAILIAASP